MIRPARPADAPAISLLLAELGYPSEIAEIPGRLAALVSAGDAVALVAELEGRVVGVVTAHLLSTLHHPHPVAWLTTLVVSHDARGSSLGRQLVRAAEDWARDAGAVRISVTSGSQRDDAHAFYRRIGYAQTGLRFGRAL